MRNESHTLICSTDFCGDFITNKLVCWLPAPLSEWSHEVDGVTFELNSNGENSGFFPKHLNPSRFQIDAEFAMLSYLPRSVQERRSFALSEKRSKMLLLCNR